MTFDEFSEARGVSRTAPSHPDSHKTSRQVSGIAKRRRMAAIAAEAAAWGEAREQLRAEYEDLVRSGAIVPPTRRERLVIVAAGHPDRPDVQAARRLLARSTQEENSPCRSRSIPRT